MSDCNRPSCSRGDAKSRHVRSLNFGRLILELDAVEQSSVPNRVLVIDENVARIPCTEKVEYVRKWLETHETGRRDPSQSSPVLGTTSATAASRRSPVLGRKRPRGKIRVSKNAAAKRLGDADRQENAEHCSASCTMRSKPHCGCKESGPKWECASGTPPQRAPPGTERVTADETSPVLGIASRRVFKKRKRKLQYEPGDSVSPKRSKSRDCKITGINIKSMTEPDGNHNNMRKTPADRDKLDENLDTRARTSVFLTEVRESPERYQEYIEVLSSPTQERLNFADNWSSNTDKNDSKIETSTSNDSKDEGCDQLTSTSSSSNNLSNFIEDIDTQEITNTSQFLVADKNLVPSGQPFTSLRLIIDDLNETYCSEAEMMQDQSTHLSARISEVASLNKTTQKTGSKSTQTDAIISTITTPSKKSPDRSMYTRLLDSGKKRRKPKKGSMVARLQSLVNAQVSGIRIWHHRMNKEHDATSARYISILVRDCAKQFGNQFLEGVLIADRYNLLQSDIRIEQSEADGAQARPKGVSYRNITIMLVCDITGTLKMVSEVVMNVYPPWNILDKDDLTLEAMYISINNNCEIHTDVENTGKSRERKERILKEFNCPCIEKQKELPFCARKFNSDKPDVMQRIFNF